MAAVRSTVGPMSFEEFLKFEEHSDIRHEFIDGHVYAFAGASIRHNRIAGNAFGQLWSHESGTDCQVFNSDTLLRVSHRISYYPDVMVVCDPTDNHDLYKSRPCLLIEVLSPSTMLTDRREKLLTYQSIESLRGYLMIYRDEIRVESYIRRNSNPWVYQNFVGDQPVWVPCLDLTLPVSTFYRDVDMSPIAYDPDEPNLR